MSISSGWSFSGPTITSIGLSTHNGPYQVSCPTAQDGEIEVNVTGGDPPYTFAWNTGQSEAALRGLGAGTYSVTITDQAVSSTTATVNLIAPPPLSAQIETTPIGCVDEQGFISVENIQGGVAPYRITVNGYPNPGENRFGFLDPGAYWVEITDGNGCTWSQSVHLGEQRVSFSLGPDIDTVLGSYLPVTPVSGPSTLSFRWEIVQGQAEISCSFCEELWIQLESPLIRLLAIGTDGDGCFLEQELLIQGALGNLGYAPNAFSPNNDGRNDQWFFYPGVAVEQVLFIRMYDRSGSLVYETENWDPRTEQRSWDGHFQGRRMPTGVYVYAIMARLVDGQEELLTGTLHLLR
ncbi:MAG: gliding motility-associated C-terminal domain-containing protein [Bacteroidota bacterium]